MITSTTEIYNTTISFTEGMEHSLNLEKLDCGFFSMFLGSHLELGHNSKIENLVALNRAVLCAFSKSTLTVSDKVDFINNKAISLQG